LEQAFDLANRSLSQARETGLKELEIADRLDLVASLEHRLGDTPDAIRDAQQALAIAESSGQTTKANMFRPGWPTSTKTPATTALPWSITRKPSR
jgi:hypothetical protein